RHGHAEVDPPTAADDSINVARFEEVSNHHLGAGGPQGRRPVVLAADHGANRKPALQEQAGHGTSDRPELTGCPGYEDRSLIGHATSLPFAERLSSVAGGGSANNYVFSPKPLQPETRVAVQLQRLVRPQPSSFL